MVKIVNHLLEMFGLVIVKHTGDKECAHVLGPYLMKLRVKNVKSPLSKSKKLMQPGETHSGSRRLVGLKLRAA